ncbi:hypothetical protein H7K06_26845 [Priestia aryabhattai]|uniref:hypothetical protein n=1 Tax=Priestia aryabhattai TaxID=412384 RepID=UPI001C8DC5F2|nr:hypothetical protein [Priestia aryabhattai]MBX9971142.1 hypothetical protein [Priestia aryabhattai]
MKSLISVIIFTLPGLLAYFWINLFGLTPTTKRESSEVVAISALLWIPIVAIILFMYQIMALITHLSIAQPPFDIIFIKKDWTLLSNKITDLNKLSENIWFLLFYIFSSIIISFLVAKFIMQKGYKFMLEQVNKVREENGIAPLSEKTTVWNEMFLNNKGQVVEFSKGESSEAGIVGSLVKVPRAHEPDKGIVLEAVDHWTKVMEYYHVDIDHTFIDTSNGTVIKVYNSDQALEAQRLYRERVDNGSIS